MKKDPTFNFQWEYILIDNDKIKNAWCMPGGKIAVYTGILKITKNKHGLAAVMGHEIAHAVAKHSVERASRALILNVGSAAIDIFTGGALSNARRSTGVDVAGMVRTFGIDNPFGRKQEREADYLCLIFSSIGGYDIKESVKIFCSSTIAITIEALKIEEKYKVYTNTGRTDANIEVSEWIKEVQDMGVGEIILTSIRKTATK